MDIMNCAKELAQDIPNLLKRIMELPSVKLVSTLALPTSIPTLVTPLPPTCLTGAVGVTRWPLLWHYLHRSVYTVMMFPRRTPLLFSILAEIVAKDVRKRFSLIDLYMLVYHISRDESVDDAASDGGCSIDRSERSDESGVGNARGLPATPVTMKDKKAKEVKEASIIKGKEKAAFHLTVVSELKRTLENDKSLRMQWMKANNFTEKEEVVSKTFAKLTNTLTQNLIVPKLLSQKLNWDPCLTQVSTHVEEIYGLLLKECAYPGGGCVYSPNQKILEVAKEEVTTFIFNLFLVNSLYLNLSSIMRLNSAAYEKTDTKGGKYLNQEQPNTTHHDEEAQIPKQRDKEEKKRKPIHKQKQREEKEKEKGKEKKEGDVESEGEEDSRSFSAILKAARHEPKAYTFTPQYRSICAELMDLEDGYRTLECIKIWCQYNKLYEAETNRLHQSLILKFGILHDEQIEPLLENLARLIPSHFIINKVPISSRERDSGGNFRRWKKTFELKDDNMPNLKQAYDLKKEFLKDFIRGYKINDTVNQPCILTAPHCAKAKELEDIAVRVATLKQHRQEKKRKQTAVLQQIEKDGGVMIKRAFFGKPST